MNVIIGRAMVIYYLVDNRREVQMVFSTNDGFSMNMSDRTLSAQTQLSQQMNIDVAVGLAVCAVIGGICFKR